MTGNKSGWIQRFEDYKERVRQRLPFDEAASHYGIKFDDRRALCFHHDSKSGRPSLHLFEDGTGAYCYKEDRSFDIFDLISHQESLTFVEAVKRAGAMAGESFDDGQADDEDVRRDLELTNERRRVEELLTLAAISMHSVLPKKYRKHLRENYGLDDETIDRNRIGWADTDGILLFFREGMGVKDEELLKTGLFIKIGKKLKCFFDGRIVFPYWRHGRAVYMIGRQTEDTEEADYERGKYKKLLVHSEKHPFVSPTIANDCLFGEDTVRGSSDHVIITEGVADALALIMLGFRVLSPVTTQVRKADTPRLIELTRRVPRVSILNDNEESERGTRGALIMGEALFREGRDVRIPMLPRREEVEKIDVCDFVRKVKNAHRRRGVTDEAELNKIARARVDKVLAKAKSYVGFLIDRIPTDIDPADLAPRLEPIFESIAVCPPVERDGYVKHVAKRFNLRRQVVEKGVGEYVEDDERRDQKDDAAEAKRNASAAKDLSDSRTRGKVFEDIDHYYVEGRIVDEVISSFTVVGKELIVTTDGKTLIRGAIRARGLDREIDHTFPSRAWSSKRDLLREIHAIHPALQFTGNDDNVQGMLACIGPETLKQRVGTSNLGLALTKRGPRWVTPKGVFGPDAPIDANDPEEIILVDSKAPISTRLRYGFPGGDALRELAGAILPKLIELNQSEVTLPLIGWFVASTLKPLFVEELGHFPIMLVHGTQGSGKTSIVRDVFWRLVGVRSDPFSCSDSHFSNARNAAASDSIPMFLDEYKRDMGRHKLEAVHRFLRRAYNSEVEFRGRADQGVNEYPLHAPIVVAGEMRPDDDPALTERLISVNPDKNAITAERKAIFSEVTRAPLHELAGPLVAFVLRQDFSTLFATAKESTDQLLEQTKRNVPPRCYDSLVVMISGLLLFESFAEEVGAELPAIDYAAAFEAVVTELLEGGDGAVKDAFDSFLEALSTMAHLGTLQEGRHYSLEEGRLFLHLSSCHSAYLLERRRMGIEDGTNGLRALKKITSEKIAAGSYVISDIERQPVGERRTRVVEIDQDKVPDSLDFDRFPANGRDGEPRGDRWSTWRGNYTKDPDEDYGPS